MTNLKDLYNKLIVNWQEHDNGREFSVPDWYARYCRFYRCVDEMRTRLKNNSELKAIDDEEFLRNLIFTNKGDISNAKRSRLSEPNFKKLISEPDFLKALEALIKVPNLDNFEAFGDTWRRCKKQDEDDNPLRINRVLAACTLKVSSTVDKTCFEKIFNKLTSEGYIDSCNIASKTVVSDELDWFENNRYLMAKLRKEFGAELPDSKTELLLTDDKSDLLLKDGETDSFLLSIFVWESYRYFFGDPNS